MNRWSQVFLASVFACIIVCAIVSVVSIATNGQEQAEEDFPVALVLDTGDPAQMHAYGLPSESDVLNWHVHGEWGYKDCDGNIRMFAQLPGEAWRWDNLYDIKWRKAFQH